MFLTNLGGSRLWDDDEPKNARCGAEMLERGEWVVPTFNDELRDHKPVLLYWAMIASYSAFGVNEFAARLPSALSCLAVAVMCYHMGRLLFDRSVGLAAGLLLSCGLMFAVLARAATPDGVLMVGTTSALLFFVSGVAARRGGHFSGEGQPAPLASFQLPIGYAIGMYVALGVAVLAKGPIGLLLPLWAICLYGLFGEPLSEPSSKRIENLNGWKRFTAWLIAAAALMRWVRGARSIRLLMGIPIVLAVAGPWYVAVSMQTSGDWLSGFLGTHNVGRFMNAMEGHNGPIIYYVVAVLAGFFPGSCFLPVAVIGSARARASGGTMAPSHALVLAIIGAWIGFFSLAATKLPNYVIPCYVGLALATAAWLVASVQRTCSVKSWLGAGLGSCCVAGLAVGIALAIVGGPLMGGTPLIGLAGLLPITGGALGLWMLSNGQPHRAMTAFVACSLVFTLTAVSVVAPIASPYADGPRLAEQVKQLETPNDPVRFVTFHYTTPSLVWTMGRGVPSLGEEATLELLAQPNTAAAMPVEEYERLKPLLPAGVTKLTEEGRFLRTHKRIALIGHRDLVARGEGKNLVR